MQAIYGAIDRDRSGGSKVVRLDRWHLPWIVTGECTVSYPIVSGLHSWQQPRHHRSREQVHKVILRMQFDRWRLGSHENVGKEIAFGTAIIGSGCHRSTPLIELRSVPNTFTMIRVLESM